MDQDKIRTRGHEENMCVVCSFASLLEINKWSGEEKDLSGFRRGSPLCDQFNRRRRLYVTHSGAIYLKKTK